MQLSNLAIDPGPAIYYDRDFRNVLESHLDYLRNLTSTTRKPVEPHLAYRYEFDFYGLLTYLQIPAHLHWVILRMNGFFSPNEVPITISSFLLPTMASVEQIRQIYQTKQA